MSDATASVKGYLPSSIKEAVRYGVGAIGLMFVLKKFAPGLALKAGVIDGVWVQVKLSDGTVAMQYQPTIPTKTS